MNRRKKEREYWANRKLKTFQKNVFGIDDVNNLKIVEHRY